jgi:hypothetical protein
MKSSPKRTTNGATPDLPSVMSENVDLPNFANSVRSALGMGVPCDRPYGGSDIQLLQLISTDELVNQVEWHGFCRRKHVAVYKPHHGRSTLQECLTDESQRQELEKLISNAGVMHFMPFNVVHSMSASFSCTAPFSWNVTRDESWSLSFGKGCIMKTLVSSIGLERFLDKHRGERSSDSMNSKSVVTAIYSVTEGLTYTGDGKRVEITTAGLLAKPTPNDGKGWECNVTRAGKVILSETNPREYIIAIEYKNLDFGQERRSWKSRKDR